MEFVARVAKLATLEAIVLKELHGDRVDDLPQPSFAANNDVTVGFAVRGKALFVTVRFVYRTQPTAINIAATFNLHYALTDEPAAEEAEAFAHINGVFNAWPYWRELAQNTATRMGIAIPPAPLLRV